MKKLVLALCLLAVSAVSCSDEFDEIEEQVEVIDKPVKPEIQSETNGQDDPEGEDGTGG